MFPLKARSIKRLDTSVRALGDQTLEINPKALKMPPQSGEAFG